MTHQPLWVILCRLPEKERKEIEEIVGDERENGRKRNRNESKETEDIKHSPSLIWVHTVCSGLFVPFAAVFDLGAHCLIRPVCPN